MQPLRAKLRPAFTTCFCFQTFRRVLTPAGLAKKLETKKSIQNIKQEPSLLIQHGLEINRLGDLGQGTGAKKPTKILTGTFGSSRFPGCTGVVTGSPLIVLYKVSVPQGHKCQRTPRICGWDRSRAVTKQSQPVTTSHTRPQFFQMLPHN